MKNIKNHPQGDSVPSNYHHKKDNKTPTLQIKADEKEESLARKTFMPYVKNRIRMVYEDWERSE